MSKQTPSPPPRYTIFVFDELEEQPVGLSEAIEHKLERFLAHCLRVEQRERDREERASERQRP